MPRVTPITTDLRQMAYHAHGCATTASPQRHRGRCATRSRGKERR
jgi:hypothetical protein